MLLLSTLAFIIATLVAAWIVFGSGAETGFAMFVADLINFTSVSSEPVIRVTVTLGWIALLYWYLTTLLGLQFF